MGIADEPVTRAFESLSTLPILEGGFLRHLLLQAIDDPDLATNASLAEHLYLVPQVLRALPPALVRNFPAWTQREIDTVAAGVAADRSDISRETLSRLCCVALRDRAFLANFLEGRPASPFL